MSNWGFILSANRVLILVHISLILLFLINCSYFIINCFAFRVSFLFLWALFFYLLLWAYQFVWHKSCSDLWNLLAVFSLLYLGLKCLQGHCILKVISFSIFLFPCWAIWRLHSPASHLASPGFWSRTMSHIGGFSSCSSVITDEAIATSVIKAGGGLTYNLVVLWCECLPASWGMRLT